MASAASAAGDPKQLQLEADVNAHVGSLGEGQTLNSYVYAKAREGITNEKRAEGLTAEQRKTREAERKDQATRLLNTHNDVVGLFKKLAAVSQLADLGTLKSTLVELTGDGERAADEGSPEGLLWALLPITLKDAEAKLGKDDSKTGMGQLKNMGLLEPPKKNAAGQLELLRKEGASFTDDVQAQLKAIEESIAAGKETEADVEGVIGKDALTKLKTRKLVVLKAVTAFTTKAGEQFGQEQKKPAAELTSALLKNDDWKNYTFKPRNFAAAGTVPDGGALHPLMKVRQEFRDILLCMGFNEMKTNQWVENSFWNFDALFVPQQHPARDQQDTFFIKDPAASTDRPQDYLDRVVEVHPKGKYGSTGYHTEFSVEETNKNILRTHTTAVSARKLYEIAQQTHFKPGKFFSIDRVFRNEEMDKTHLCEFHQIEGFIIDKNLSLGNMMAILQDFFLRIGVKDLAFKPAYNPYTEPSMEIFGFHEGLGKQIEVGNSGVFRPEMLRPMGFAEDVTVIAWGLSLERPAMIRYGLNDIHELFGPKVSVKKVHENPICRY